MARGDGSSWRMLPITGNRSPCSTPRRSQRQAGLRRYLLLRRRSTTPTRRSRTSMLHLVEMKEKLAKAEARHADQASVLLQLRTVTATPGEPQPKSFGSAKSESKALTLAEATTQGQAQLSFLQGRPASPPGRPRRKLFRMTWIKPRSDCEEMDCVSLRPEGNELALKYETVETSALHEVVGTSDRKLVRLSFFDGIGAAHVALANLGVKPSFAMSFENDEECKSVLRARFPDVEIISSYDLYRAEELMECIKRATSADDDFVVLVTAGPPCQDFSRIKGSTSKGRTSPEGEKFVKFVELLHNLHSAADSRGWGFHFVVENVVMNGHEAHYFNTQLGIQSFVMDAGDMTCASRPRLWWTSFPSGEESALRMAEKDIPALKWFTSGKEGLIHLIMPVEKLNAASLVWGDVHCVTDGKTASCGPCRLRDEERRPEGPYFHHTCARTGWPRRARGQLAAVLRGREAPVAGRSPTVRAMAIRAARDDERREAALRRHARGCEGGPHGLSAQVHVHRQGRGHERGHPPANIASPHVGEHLARRHRPGGVLHVPGPGARALSQGGDSRPSPAPVRPCSSTSLHSAYQPSGTCHSAPAGPYASHPNHSNLWGDVISSRRTPRTFAKQRIPGRPTSTPIAS